MMPGRQLVLLVGAHKRYLSDALGQAATHTLLAMTYNSIKAYISIGIAEICVWIAWQVVRTASVFRVGWEVNFIIVV